MEDGRESDMENETLWGITAGRQRLMKWGRSTALTPNLMKYCCA